MNTKYIPSNWIIERDRWNRIIVHDEDGISRCGCKIRNQEKCCRARPYADGNGRCYYHNGNAPFAFAHHSWKTGEHGKYLNFSRRRKGYKKLTDKQVEIALRDVSSRFKRK